MQTKIILKNSKRYAEVPQVNPLRWKTMLQQDDGSFIDQSGWIKCKDFFNDTVAFFNEGSVFSIYSYDNNIKKNVDGVWMLLKYLNEPETFKANLALLNKKLVEDGFTAMSTIATPEADELLVLIPNDMWKTTYHISLITMAIRLCNYGVKYASWEEFWTPDSPCQKIDRVFTTLACKNVTKYGFKIPEKYAKYWWYCGKDYNSEKIKNQTGGTIHNNGVCNWSEYMGTV